MKVKFCFIIFVVFLMSFSATYAQDILSIKGIVLDSASKKPVPYVTVILKTVNGIAVKSTFTQNDGSFLLEKLATGKYTVTIGAIDYRPRATSADLSNSTKQMIDLGKILLSQQHIQLKEVQVNGMRPVVTQEIDRLIYNVQADPESKSQNMLNIMQKVPLLSLDGDDNIQLKGSSDFKIFINGKPSGMMARNPAMALRSMRASNVLRVEVITTPSAKYDSEGAAGIINIVTKNNMEGYNVIFEILNNTQLGAYGIGSAFTVKEGKFGINGYVGRYLFYVPDYTINNSRTIFSPVQSTVKQHGNIDAFTTSLPANADLSYEIDSLNLLTSSIVFSRDNRDQTDIQSFDSYNQSDLNSSYNMHNESTSRIGGIDVGINYQMGFKKKKDKLLTTSYKYSSAINDYNSNNIATGNFNYIDNQLIQENNAGLKEQTIQIDYINPGKKVNLETGAKLIKRDNYSDFDTESFAANGSSASTDQFNYGQNTYSLYNSYQFKLNNWGVNAGLRLERTVINADFITSNANLNRDYNNLIPSVIIQRKFKNLNSLNLGYTQRIQRPDILQLNPFVNQSNPLYYTSGNPNLVAVLNNTFNMNYSMIKKAIVNINLDYSFANNTIQNVASLGSDGITRYSFANIGKNDNMGTNLSINYPITQNFSATFNGRVQYSWLNGTVNGTPYKNKGLFESATTTLFYKTKNDWRISMVVNGRSSIINLQGQINGYFTSYCRVNKEFFHNKLGIIVTVRNLNQTFRNSVNQIRTADFIQENITRKQYRGFYFNVYYSIGKLKEKIRKTKKVINNDDLNHTKSDDND